MANPEVAYKLVLLRHGTSEWNAQNRFTGWTEVDLNPEGVVEAHNAAVKIREAGFTFDKVHTSLLKRAINTANTVVSDLDLHWLPVERSWRLNERMYGALQGLNKSETTEKHGAEQVHIWRRSYATPPPPLELSDERHPSHDRKYADLPPELVPSSECLKDVVDRMLPYWFDNIVPDLRAGKRLLVVAHGNSLRALVKYLDKVEDDVISDLNIPTAFPLVYELDKDLKPIKHYYLGSAEEAEAAAAAVAAQAAAKKA